MVINLISIIQHYWNKWIVSLKKQRIECTCTSKVCSTLLHSGAYKGLFTWREGAPANRATRLEGLKHSPPTHATHLTGTESGLRELSLERPLSTTNITADQGNLFSILFQLPAWAWACSLPEICLLHWSLQIDCHSVQQITLANGNYENIHFVSAMFSQSISPRLAKIARLEPFTWQKASPPSRVPRASRQGAPGSLWATLSGM